MPERIQLRRTTGWRKPAGAVKVARPTRWGNPYRVVPGRMFGGDRYYDVVQPPGTSSPIFLTGDLTATDAAALAVKAFRLVTESGPVRNGQIHRRPDYPLADEIRAELAGLDLMCFCPLDQPCHADVLLDIANRTETTP